MKGKIYRVIHSCVGTCRTLLFASMKFISIYRLRLLYKPVLAYKLAEKNIFYKCI